MPRFVMPNGLRVSPALMVGTLWAIDAYTAANGGTGG
jgi:hypothetical protein